MKINHQLHVQLTIKDHQLLVKLTELENSNRKPGEKIMYGTDIARKCIQEAAEKRGIVFEVSKEIESAMELALKPKASVYF